MTRARPGMVLWMGLVLLGAGPGALAAPAADAARAGLDPAKLSSLRPQLEKLVADRQIAGAVTVVARGGKVGSFEAVGYRDLEAKAPMRKDTIFRIASMTKIATAVAVLLLEDQGKLSVDDPVEKHLPEFRGQKLIQKQEGATTTLGNSPRPITVKDLLTHTSGMRCQPPAGFSDLGSKKNRTLTEAVVAFSQQPLETAPGKTWKYCGTAFGTLGRIVEVASGLTFAKFLETKVLRPLGMKDTTFQLSPAQQARLAVAYKKDVPAAPAGAAPAQQAAATTPGTIIRSENQGVPRSQPVIYTDPGGGLYSTAADYTRLMQMLVDRGRAGGRVFLRPETVVKLTGVHFSSKEKVGFSPGLGMGLGVQVVMTPTEVTESLSAGSFGHGGAHGTQAWADPATGVVYILMIQRQGFGNGDQSDVRRVFQRVAASAIVDSPAPATPRQGRAVGASGRRP
jgi:CubicO group peptidase (beta-lactamase class C family)